MCGIVGGVTQRNVLGILVEGLKRLEYRGYDSAGVALVEPNGDLSVRKALGKVSELEKELADNPTRGNLGIAHTRWATRFLLQFDIYLFRNQNVNDFPTENISRVLM